MVEAGMEVNKFKKKHDEMFDSVSGLNSRIEELEQHKLHLLEKLKGYVSLNYYYHLFSHRVTEEILAILSKLRN